MRLLRVLIADDERMARTRLQRLLGAMEDVVVVGEASDGAEVLDHARHLGSIDLILLDIHMPGLDGLDTLGLLGPHGPAVVFTTAHADHALSAFDGGAVDYVLKPIEPARLRLALDRVRDRRAAPDPLERPPSRFALPTPQGVVLLDPDEISHAVIDGASVKLVTTRGVHFTDLPLSTLQARLPDGFLRAHRQALIHLAHVERMQDADSGGYLAVMRDGSRVAVSRQVARRLRKAWRLG